MTLIIGTDIWKVGYMYMTFAKSIRNFRFPKAGSPPPPNFRRCQTFWLAIYVFFSVRDPWMHMYQIDIINWNEQNRTYLAVCHSSQTTESQRAMWWLFILLSTSISWMLQCLHQRHDVTSIYRLLEHLELADKIKTITLYIVDITLLSVSSIKSCPFYMSSISV
jgi:hypothetical protein